jgi:hypothetical protein
MARLLPLILFLTAFSIRLAWTSSLSSRPVYLTGESQRIALSLVKGEGFANPYIVPTGYTAHLAPLQPLLQSWIYRAFGTGIEGEAARIILNSLFISLAIALFPSIAVRLNLPWQTAGWAGAAACWPSSTNELMSHFGEPLTALVIVAGLWLLLRYRPLATAAALVQGVMLGLLALVNPVTAAILALLFVVRWAYSKDAFDVHLRAAAISLVVAALMVTPWIVRNYIRLGGLALVRSNFGLELQVAHNPIARPTFNESISAHPNLHKREAERVAAIGEIAYNHEKRAQAIQWILANPSATATLTAKRIVAYWLPAIPDGRAARYICWLLTAAGSAGLVTMFFRNREASLWLGSIMLSSFGFYICFNIDFRYRLPTYWTTQLCAGYCAAFLIERYRWRFHALRKALIGPFSRSY